MVRIPAIDVKAVLGDLAGELINISTSGALLRLDRQVPVGRRAALALSKGRDGVNLPVEVVRTAALRDSNGSRLEGWGVGVTFGSISFVARIAISKLLAE